MSIIRKKILPLALTIVMALGSMGTVYAEEPVSDDSGTIQESSDEKENTENETADEKAAEKEAVLVSVGAEEGASIIADTSKPEGPVLYTVHLDEETEHGRLLAAGQAEDIQAEEGTVIYITAEPAEGYETAEIQVLNEEQKEVETEPVDSQNNNEIRFTMPASDVLVKGTFSAVKQSTQTDKKTKAVEQEESVVMDVVDTDNDSSGATVKNMTITMLGYQSYELAGYGSGYDAAFAVADGQYEGNPNAFCLNPAVQAPGSSNKNTAVTYNCSVEDYTDQMLLKIMYYGFTGGGDITADFADNAPARHILTHMVAVKRAAELGISGAGDYTYKANAKAIALADQLYEAIKAQPDVVGTVSVLTPVSGLQTIILLSSFGVKTGKLRLVKTSADTSLTNGNPCYSLEGAVYGVYSDSECKTKVGSFTTESDGTSTEELTLDPGTYYVKETKAPKGYLLNETIYPAVVRSGNTTTVNTEDIPGNDPVKLLIEKKDAKTGKTSEELAGAEFTVQFYAAESEDDLVTPEATWVFATDKDGKVNLDEDHKMSGDALYTDESTGTPVLPLGVITIQETKAPEGYLINDTIYTCNTTEDNGVITTSNLPTGENAVKETPVTPVIKTEALSKTTGTHTAASSSKETIVDTVSYTDLIPGREYTIKGEVLTLDSEEVIASGEITFTPEKANGSADVEFTVDTGKLEGKTLVVYEELYKGTEKQAEHKEKTDVKQQISVPKIRTTASVDGAKEAVVSSKTTITDVVSYENLIAGQEYTVRGVLMNKATGKELLVDGKAVTAEKTFTAETADGSVEMTFTLDSSSLSGVTTVVFESLYHNGIEVTSHADLNDSDQTVVFKEKPVVASKISSTAPKTGDTASAVLYASLLLGAFAVLLGIVAVKRRKE